jgi:hypothetical protein
VWVPTGRVPVASLALAGAGSVALAAGRPWALVRGEGLPGTVAFPVGGDLPARGTLALAAVVAAGAVVLVTGGPRLRRGVAVVLLVCALVTAGLALLVLVRPSGTLAAAVAEVTGVHGATAVGGSLTVTWWPVVALLGALLVGIAAVVAVAGANWSEPTRRFEVGRAVSDPNGTGAGPLDPRDAWDALSGGQDPT